MQLFLPSILIAILAILVVIFLIPRFSPIIIVILAAVLLYVGTTQHLSMFWDEYKQSTWQEGLKLFAPGIMIGAIVIFVLYGILSFFGGGSVPIPSMPTLELPSANTATNPVTAVINTAMNTVNDVTNTVNNTVNNTMSNLGISNVKRNNLNNGVRKMNTNNKNNNSGPTRSYLATA